MAYQQQYPQPQFIAGQVPTPGFNVAYPATTYQPVIPAQSRTPAAANSRGRTRFAKDSQLRCGVLQIVLGAAAVILGIGAIAIGAGVTYGGYGSLAYCGSGIWCGVIFIIAGVLGVVSSKNVETCAIVGCMVLSILATLFGIVFLGFAITMCIFDDIFRYQRRYEYGEYNSYPIRNLGGRLTIDSLTLIVALAEIVVSIIQSAICCRTTCCIQTRPATTVIYVPQPCASQYAFPTAGYVQSSNIPAGNALISTVPVPTHNAPAPYIGAAAVPQPAPAFAPSDQPPPYTESEKQPTPT